jgi:hypothetical protein
MHGLPLTLFFVALFLGEAYSYVWTTTLSCKASIAGMGAAVGNIQCSSMQPYAVSCGVAANSPEDHTDISSLFNLPPGAALLNLSCSGAVNCMGNVQQNFRTQYQIYQSCETYTINGDNKEPISVSTSGFMVITYELPELPPCSQPKEADASECEGGKGLSLTGNSFHIGNKLYQMFGSDFENYTTTLNKPNHVSNDGDILTRPDGTECNLEGTGGDMYNYLVCPLGEAQSSSSSEDGESSSSGENQRSSSSGKYPDPCEDFPDLPQCRNNSSDSGSGGGSGGENGSCKNLNNCSWARIDVQLAELGVAQDIRSGINNLAGLLQNGYNIESQQLGALNGIIGALGSGTSDIVGAINGLAGALGTGGGGTNSDGVAEGMGKFFNDTTGINEAKGESESEGQGGVDSLDSNIDWLSADGAKKRIRGQIDSTAFMNFQGFSQQFADSVNLYIAPLTSYISRFSPRTRIDMSFETGVMGIGCKNCGIDLTNIYGFNAISFFNGILILGASIMGMILVFRTVKTGGHD